TLSDAPNPPPDTVTACVGGPVPGESLTDGATVNALAEGLSLEASACGACTAIAASAMATTTAARAPALGTLGLPARHSPGLFSICSDTAPPLPASPKACTAHQRSGKDLHPSPAIRKTHRAGPA